MCHLGILISLQPDQHLFVWFLFLKHPARGLWQRFSLRNCWRSGEWSDCFQGIFRLQVDQKCISGSHFTREHISLSFFQRFLLIFLPSQRAGVSEQRPSLSSCGIVGDQESGHSQQQQVEVEEVQWRGCWSRLRSEKISNENSTLKSNWKLPGDARAVWPPGPGPPLLLLGIQR